MKKLTCLLSRIEINKWAFPSSSTLKCCSIFWTYSKPIAVLLSTKASGQALC